MKDKQKSKGKKLLCPKACVLNQLDDDRHSDTVVLETQKAIAFTLGMLTNDGQKARTVLTQNTKTFIQNTWNTPTIPSL